MDLFEVTNRRAFPSAHALLIEPFRNIWENDLTKEKGQAMQIFSYVELVCSPKKSNPYFGYPETERPAKVKKELWGDNVPTDLPVSTIMEACIKYRELLEAASPTYSLYISSLAAAEKLKSNLSNIKLDERTTSGTAVTKPKDITSALKEIPDVIKSLEALRTKVNSELIEDTKTRNAREIGLFER